jgi:hypothetical protein
MLEPASEISAEDSGRPWLFWCLFCALSAALGAALFSGPLLPWRDLPDHLALISLLDHVQVPGSVAAAHYEVQFYPLPYWVFYGSVWLFARVFEITTAVQLVALGGLVTTGLAVGHFARTLGRDGRWGLLALPLFFNHNLMWGWLSYCLAIPVFFVACSALLRRLRGEGSGPALAAWSSVLFLAHAQLAALFAVVCAVWLLLPGLRSAGERLRAIGPPLLAPVLLGLPWLLARAAGDHGRGEVNEGPALIFHDPVTRLKRLADHMTNCWSGDSDDWMWLVTAALIGLLWGSAKKEGRVRLQRYGTSLVLLLVTLYFVAPWEVRWPVNQWSIYSRFAILVPLAAIGMIEAPFPRRASELFTTWPGRLLLLWLVPVLIFAWNNAAVYRAFNLRNAFVLHAVEQLPPNLRILPQVHNAGDPASHLGAADQFHAYYVVRHGGYDPYLFDNPSHPVVHRKAAKISVPKWNRPGGAGIKKVFARTDKPSFDLLLRQGPGGPAARPMAGFSEPQRVGRWTLYQRERP